MNGVFITFEGPEGAGKTTQLHLLAQYLTTCSVPVEVIREPGGTSLGEKVRELLLDPAQDIAATTEVYLYAAARAQLVEKLIKPGMEAGRVILCDRYVDASIAYQGYGRGLGPEQVRYANTMAVDGIWPDLTILLDIATEEGLQRARNRRQGLDRIELEEVGFHQAVRQGYLAQAKLDPHRFLVIDAAMPVDIINASIRTRILELLCQKGWNIEKAKVLQ